MTEFHITWLYRAWPDKIADFERVYGADGVWAQFFRRSSDFLGTELYRSSDESGRYLVVDRWRSAGSHKAFAEGFGAEYAALSSETADLHMDEERVGSFELL